MGAAQLVLTVLACATATVQGALLLNEASLLHGTLTGASGCASLSALYQLGDRQARAEQRVCLGDTATRRPFAFVLPAGTAGQLMVEHEQTRLRWSRFFAVAPGTAEELEVDLTAAEAPAERAAPLVEPAQPAAPAPPGMPRARRPDGCSTHHVFLGDRTLPELLALARRPPPATCAAPSAPATAAAADAGPSSTSTRLPLNSLLLGLAAACTVQACVLAAIWWRRGQTSCVGAAGLALPQPSSLVPLRHRAAVLVDACCSPVAGLVTPSWLQRKQAAVAAAELQPADAEQQYSGSVKKAPPTLSLAPATGGWSRDEWGRLQRQLYDAQTGALRTVPAPFGALHAPPQPAAPPRVEE